MGGKSARLLPWSCKCRCTSKRASLTTAGPSCKAGAAAACKQQFLLTLLVCEPWVHYNCMGLSATTTDLAGAVKEIVSHNGQEFLPQSQRVLRNRKQENGCKELAQR